MGVHNDLLNALQSSLAAGLPGRQVSRKLAVPGAEKSTLLQAGVVSVVATGGGNFANWSGREGELGDVDFSLFCPVKVAEKGTTSEDVELAELDMLDEVLAWCQSTGKPAILGEVVPLRWRNSAQTSFPYGWIVVDMTARNVG